MKIELADTKLGRNIVYLRKKYRVSRTAVANLAGISRYILKDWEEEICRPIIDHRQLKRLAAIFDISSEALVNENLPM